jgi:hypothetical protein
LQSANVSTQAVLEKSNLVVTLAQPQHSAITEADFGVLAALSDRFDLQAGGPQFIDRASK